MDEYHELLTELKNYLKTFVGKTEEELFNLLNFSSNAKSKRYILARKICDNFRGRDKFEALIDYEKIIVKTIQLKENGKSKEAMSFSPFKFKEVVKEDWEHSSLRKYFYENTFLFFVFKRSKNSNTLIKILFWRMPIVDIDGELKIVWQKTIDVLNSGEVVKEINEKNSLITNFPREADNINFHIRPHGSSGADIDELPVKDLKTGLKFIPKHSFWFNHDYLNKISSGDGGSL